MDAAVSRTMQQGRRGNGVAPAVVAATISLFVVVVATIVLLIIRRAAGGLVQPLPPTALWVAGAIVAALCAALRRGVMNVFAPGAASAWALFPSITGLLLVALLSLVDSTGMGLAGLWGIPAIAEGWAAVGRRFDTKQPRSSAVRHSARPGIAAAALDDVDGTMTADVIQQMTRRRDAAGSEIITGALRCTLEPGAKLGWLHVAFCPPFDYTPTVEAEVVHGAATLRVGPIYPHGTRIEVRGQETACRPTDVVVEFAADATHGGRE